MSFFGVILKLFGFLASNHGPFNLVGLLIITYVNTLNSFKYFEFLQISSYIQQRKSDRLQRIPNVFQSTPCRDVHLTKSLFTARFFKEFTTEIENGPFRYNYPDQFMR